MFHANSRDTLMLASQAQTHSSRKMDKIKLVKGQDRKGKPITLHRDEIIYSLRQCLWSKKSVATTRLTDT
jgi:hypothetical protein